MRRPGISHLVYSNFAYGKKERSSLSDFKERNGFNGSIYPAIMCL